MHTNHPYKRKLLASLSLVGLALIVTGWTMARNAPPDPSFPAFPAFPAFPVPAIQSTAKTADSQYALVQKVNAALAKQSKLKGEKIQVESAEGGKVRLSGNLSHQTKRALAIQTAEKAAGKANIISVLSINCAGIQCAENCCCSVPNDPQTCQCQQQPCGQATPKPKKTD